jgi:predicted restriction endonuclease
VASGDDYGLGEEPQRGFEADHTLDAYTGLYRLVLLSYGNRCALTGARFGPPVLALHADLDVEAIQPREQGGPLSIANYLPMIASLASPFRSGLITVEDDYRIVVPHPDLLDRTMLTALRATLIVPDDVLFRPGAEFLAHHRRYALSR